MRALVTGVTGTLGKRVSRLLIENKHFDTVIGISRDEQKQKTLKLPEEVETRLGDITDPNCFYGLGQIDFIFHFAALKHVDLLESNPLEAYRVNVKGTENVFRFAQRKHIPVLFTSTDKAVSPINTYGFTKALGERIILSEPRNKVCRYGNVLGSRGSVLDFFIKTLDKENTVYITDLEMTRFWFTVDDAAEFVCRRRNGDPSKRIFIPHIFAASISDLARTVAKVMGKDSYTTMVTGIRPGEKIHESLDHQTHSNDPVLTMSETELLQLVAPLVEERCDRILQKKA